MPGFTESTRTACTEADHALNRARGGARGLADNGPGESAVLAVVAVAEQVRALRLVIAERGDER